MCDSGGLGACFGLVSEGNERGERGHLIGGADREFRLLEDAD